MTLSIIVANTDKEHHGLDTTVRSIMMQGCDDVQIVGVGSIDGFDWEEALSGSSLLALLTLVRRESDDNAVLRDAALRHCQGHYVWMLTAGDSLAPYTLPVIMARLGAHPDYDMMECPVSWTDKSGAECTMTFGSAEYNDITGYWTGSQAFDHPWLCNKIFRRSLLASIPVKVDADDYELSTLLETLDRCHVFATTEEGGIWHPGADIQIEQMDDRQLHYRLRHYTSLIEQWQLTETPTAFYAHTLRHQLEWCLRTRHQPQLQAPRQLRRSDIRQASTDRAHRRLLTQLHHLGMNNLCRYYRIQHRWKKKHRS